MHRGSCPPPLTDVVVISRTEDVGLVVGVSHHLPHVRLKVTGQLVRQILLCRQATIGALLFAQMTAETGRENNR